MYYLLMICYYQIEVSIPTSQVLIMDEVTVKVMSYSCKMADITDEGISCKLVICCFTINLN